jgi:hypothetical protein
MSGSDEKPYQVTEAKGRFEVRDDSGRCVVTFGDNGSAEALAVLLNEVYRKGYKTGYRAGKQRGNP